MNFQLHSELNSKHIFNKILFILVFVILTFGCKSKKATLTRIID